MTTSIFPPSTTMTGVTPKKIRWAIGGGSSNDGLVRQGVPTFLYGRPGATKSMVGIDLASQLTNGVVGGLFDGKKTHILYITPPGENDKAESVMPRLLAAGGDPAFFHHWDAALKLDNDDHRQELRNEIRRTKTKVVFIDTLASYSNTPLSNPAAPTKLIDPLRQLAKETDIALILIVWANKAGKGLAALPGPVANLGLARGAVVVGPISDTEKIIGVEKANDSAEGFGFVYTFEKVEVRAGITAPKIEWVRSAKPGEIELALQVVRTAADPNVEVLLEYMATPSESWIDLSPAELREELKRPDLTWEAKLEIILSAGYIPSKELDDHVESMTVCSTGAARKTRKSAASAHLIEQIGAGQSGNQNTFWRITALGRLWLQDDEEGAIHEFFHTDRKPKKANSKASKRSHQTTLRELTSGTPELTAGAS